MGTDRATMRCPQLRPKPPVPMDGRRQRPARQPRTAKTRETRYSAECAGKTEQPQSGGGGEVDRWGMRFIFLCLWEVKRNKSGTKPT